MPSPGSRQDLRVLQVLAHDAVGGTEFMVAMLVPELRRRGMHVEVAFLQGRGPVSAALRRRGAPTHTLGDRRIAAAIPGLARLLRRHRFDIINVYGIKASMIVRAVSRAVGQPALVVCGVQGLHVTETEETDSPKAKLALGLERAFSRWVDLYESNSTGALEVLRGAGIDPAKLHYVPNGVDLSQWSMRDGPPALPVPKVLCTSRFVPRKRQEDVVEAVAILRERGIAVRMVFAGEGPTLPDITALTARHGLEGSVDLLGNVDAETLRGHFEDAVAFCHVSTWEGMPAAVMEAMARGVPVVGTAVNGVTDLIDDDVTGLLVPVGQPPAIADAVERLITNPELCARLAAAARARIEERHTLDIMVTTKCALYARESSTHPVG